MLDYFLVMCGGVLHFAKVAWQPQSDNKTHLRQKIGSMEQFTTFGTD